VGYRGLQYEPTSGFGRIWPIASMEFHKLFRTKRGLGLFIAAYWYVLIKIGALYVFLGVAMDEDGRTVRRTFETMQRMSSGANALINPFVPAFYFDHALEHGFLAFLILTSLVSVRAIAGDRATNALEIYWTRSISTVGYFLGKWLGSFLLLTAVFVGGPLFCWIFSLLIAPDWDYVGHTIAYVPGVLAVLLLQCLVLSFLAVGFSAVARSPNLATFLWVGVLLGSAAAAKLMEELARHFWADWDAVLGYDAVSVWDAVSRICYDLVGELRPGRSPDDYSVGLAWWSLAAYVTAVILILWRQLRTDKGVA
jgi:ABC-type transport system involved in multi-copper enzyme maturation permease subunit